jgi:hypothetical protein
MSLPSLGLKSKRKEKPSRSRQQAKLDLLASCWLYWSKNKCREN